MPELYDKETIDQLEWPSTIDSEYAKRFLIPLVKNGIPHYVDNIHASIYALKVGENVLPLVVAEKNSEDSHVASVLSFYISCALETLHIIENRFIQNCVKKVLGGFRRLFSAGDINSVVYVNHWLLAVDLYPAGLKNEDLQAILDFLSKRFPRHAISFRSLNTKLHENLQKTLKNMGCHLIAARQVYLTDPTKEEIFQTRIIKSDLKLHRETPFKFVDREDLSKEERLKVLQLYRKLYVEDHSPLQPQLNKNFIHHVFDEKLYQIKVLKINGEIEGVIGYYEKNGVMLCPFFGYDKGHKDSAVIYRLLSIALLLEAKNKGLIFHQSAGASFFKKVRRAEGHLESIAVYTKHLPFKQKLPWITLKTFINTFGAYYMRKY